MTKTVFRVGLFTFLLALASLLIQPLAGAASANEASGLRLSPLRSYPAQDPGSSSVGSLKITNLSDKTQTISLSTEDFGVVGEDYDYKFSDSDDTAWVKFADSKVTLAGKESKVVSYSLDVPDSASPGGHYFALIATADNTKSSSNIVELKRVASLVYLQVSGNLIQKSDLVSFEAPWFSFSRKIDLEARLNNQGNVHLRSRLKLEQIRLPFGRTATIEQAEALLMPGTTRKLVQTTDLSAIPGVYKLTAQYSPPQGGTIIVTRTVFYLPIWLISTAIIFVIWFIWQARQVFRHSKHKKYKIR